MYCSKCGNKCNDNVDFCGMCGAPLKKKDKKRIKPINNHIVEEEQQIKSEMPRSVVEEQKPETKTKQPKKKGKFIIISLIIILLLLLGAAVLYLNNLNKNDEKLYESGYKSADKAGDVYIRAKFEDFDIDEVMECCPPKLRKSIEESSPKYVENMEDYMKNIKAEVSELGDGYSVFYEVTSYRKLDLDMSDLFNVSNESFITKVIPADKIPTFLNPLIEKVEPADEVWIMNYNIYYTDIDETTTKKYDYNIYAIKTHDKWYAVYYFKPNK